MQYLLLITERHPRSHYNFVDPAGDIVAMGEQMGFTGNRLKVPGFIIQSVYI